MLSDRVVRIGRRAPLALCAAVVAALPAPAAAGAQVSPGGFYSGAVEGGGTVELTVSGDGTKVTRFAASDVPGTYPLGTCTATAALTDAAVAITGGTFHFSDPLLDRLTVNGSFSRAQFAEGDVRISTSSLCKTATLRWTATTTTPPGTPTPSPPPPSGSGESAPPVSLGPADRAAFPLWTRIAFRIRTFAGDERLWLHISRSPTRDDCGVIGRDVELEKLQATGDPAVYEARPELYRYDGFWMGEPGTYYWQAYRIS